MSNTANNAETLEPNPVNNAQHGHAPKSWQHRLKQFAPIIITLILFSAGIYALYHLLAPLKFSEVMTQIKSTPWHVMLLAVLGTFVGYIALIGYDWSAMKYIKKQVPMPLIALGGFLGYAFGNTIGLSAISGGAVRYRIYSAQGLTGFDVAAITSFAILAYGIGATILGLGALAYHPHALAGVTQFSPATLRWGSVAIVLSLIGFLLFLTSLKQPLKIYKLNIHPPSIHDLGRQMIFTFGDLIAASLVLYVLLPTGALPYSTFIAVFTIATMIGLMSHVPGGIGVFESIVIAALPSTVALNEAVTGLLLFRLIYFLLPFVLALFVLALSELFVAKGKHQPKVAHASQMHKLQPILQAGRSIIPRIVATLVLLSGAYMMIVGWIHDPTDMQEDFEILLPLALSQGGLLVSSLVGSGLMVLSLGLWRRIRLAYWLTLMVMIMTSVIDLRFGFDVGKFIYLLVLALLFFPYLQDYYRSSNLKTLYRHPLHIAIFLSLVSVMVAILWHSTTSVIDHNQPWWGLMILNQRVHLQGIVFLFATLGVLGYLGFILSPKVIHSTPSDAEAIDRARGIIQNHGTSNDLLMLTGDKQLMFAEDNSAVLAFAIQGKSWVCFSAPVGSESGRKELAWSFVETAHRFGDTPVFYEAAAEFLPLSTDLSLTANKMGEEALIDLTSFSLEGPARKKLRTSYNRAKRDGLNLDIIKPPFTAALFIELSEISETWLAQMGGSEKQFSVGKFNENYLNTAPLAVVSLNDKPVAFANLLMVERDKSVSIDLMRYSDAAPGSTMEFLFVELMVQLSEAGHQSLSLGMSPLSGLENRPGSSMWSKFGSLLYRRGGRFYNFQGLRRFKEKFDPEWQPRYLVSQSIGLPVMPLKDAMQLISGRANSSSVKTNTVTE